jgi:hypothetical protein
MSRPLRTSHREDLRRIDDQPGKERPLEAVGPTKAMRGRFDGKGELEAFDRLRLRIDHPEFFHAMKPDTAFFGPTSS